MVSGRQAVEQESEIEHPLGHRTSIAIGAAPVRDYLGAIVGCVCIFHDIAWRKEIERLYNQIQGLDKVKNDLTHMIVHDLRPLSPPSCRAFSPFNPPRRTVRFSASPCRAAARSWE